MKKLIAKVMDNSVSDLALVLAFAAMWFWGSENTQALALAGITVALGARAMNKIRGGDEGFLPQEEARNQTDMEILEYLRAYSKDNFMGRALKGAYQNLYLGLHDATKEWKSKKCKQPLHRYLGMTLDEYLYLRSNSKALPSIVANRVPSTNAHSLITPHVVYHNGKVFGATAKVDADWLKEVLGKT
jgi:hypothetical protein